MGYGFSMFSFMEIIFPLFFLAFFGILIFTIGRSIKEWNYNNKQPILNVDAVVVAKRPYTSRHHNNNHTHTTTTYYVTFEVLSGDRIELKVPDKEYGMIVEGDKGNLIFQGTRYHGFDREI